MQSSAYATGREKERHDYRHVDAALRLDPLYVSLEHDASAAARSRLWKLSAVRKEVTATTKVAKGERMTIEGRVLPQWLLTLQRWKLLQWGPLESQTGDLVQWADLVAACPPQDREAELLAAVMDFVEWHGACHSDDCPADDTCDCIGGAINARVNAAINASAAALPGAVPAQPEGDPVVFMPPNSERAVKIVPATDQEEG